MADTIDRIPASSDPQSAVRKPYSAPRLQVLGDVVEITRGTGVGVFDTVSFGLATTGGGGGGFS